MNKRQFARGTDVPAAKTKYEIEWTLSEYGASHVATMSAPGEARIAFRYKDRNFIIPIPLPDPQDREFTHTPERGFRRTDEDARKAYQQEINRRWRCLLITIKSTVEMCNLGVMSLEQAFLAFTALPTGQTVGEALEHQIREACESGRPLALMPGGTAE